MVNVLAGFPPTTVKSQNDTVKQTTFNLEAPNYQATSLNGTTKLIETGNDNELVNPSFEHSTVAYGWSIANGVSSSSSTAIAGKKSNSIALSGALEFYQEVNTGAAQKANVQMVASIWVNSSDVSDLQLCSLKNGSEDKCTVTGGYVQGSGWRQLTVSFLGDSTSNGLKLKSTDTTGTVLVDSAFVGIGSPVVDFTPDMVYSAKVSAAGVVSDENTDWINGNASISNTSTYTITFNGGLFTQTPNCVATVNQGSTLVVMMEFPTTISNVYPRTVQSTSAANFAGAFTLYCQKQGADYKTSKAYVASSSDVGWTSYVPTIVGFGTTSAQAFEWKRDGDSLYIRGTFTAGTPTATEARLPLPNSVAIDSGIATLLSGAYYKGDAAVVHGGPLIVQGGLSYLKFSNPAVYGSVSASALTAVNGSDIANSSEIIKVEAGPIRITDWQDSSVIVGSFQGYNETQGVSNPKMCSFFVSNAIGVENACSSATCVTQKIKGNCATSTSVTRSGNGRYTYTFPSNYWTDPTNVNCTVQLVVGGSGRLWPYTNSLSSTIRSISFDDSSATGVDASFTVICHGN